MTPEQKRLDAIKLFRKIRCPKNQALASFIGPDMTEYELVTPIAHLDETSPDRLQNEIDKATSKGEKERVSILKNRMATYRIMYAIALDKDHSYEEKDWEVVEQNFSQEIKERSAHIQDAMYEIYGKGTQKANEECKLLCGAMHGNFDILYANLYNKLFRGKKQYKPKPESLAAIETYRKKKIREAGFKEENYQDDKVHCPENKAAALGIFSTSEKKFHYTNYSYR